MATFHERLAILVEANAGRAIAEFHKVGAAAKTVEGEAAAAGGQVGLLGRIGATSGNLLKAGLVAGAATAGAAIAKFAIEGVNSFVALAGQIRAFQRVSGASAEDASKLVAAFHILGIESTTAQTAIFQLAKRVETSGDKLAAVGVQVARSKTGTVDLVGTLLNVADAYRGTEDPAERANIAFQAFGRGGAALLPLLGKTREQLEEIFAAAERHGLIFSAEQLEKAREYQVATRELGAAFEGLSIEVGEKLIPALTDLAVLIEKVTSASNSPVGKGLQGLATAINPVALAMKVGSTVLHHFVGEETDAAKAADEAATAMEEQAVEVDALTKSIFTATDAQRTLDDSGRTLAASQRGLVKSTADYNKLVADGAVDEQKVADARQSLADATRSAAGAQRELAKAQKTYDEALTEVNELGLDSSRDKLAEASDGLADAQDNVAAANERATNAAEDLKTAQAGDPEFQDKLADAKQTVADATQGVADATYNLGKRSYENVAAHAAETKAIGEKADQVDALRGNIEELLRLHPEQSPFLSDVLAALASGSLAGQGLTATAGPGGALLGGLAGGGGIALGGISPKGALVGATPSTGGGGNVTINQTFNYPIDPAHVAADVAWALVP